MAIKVNHEQLQSLRNLYVKAHQNKSLSIILIINVILRIPRVPSVVGDDVFVVLWMGRILEEGNIVNWTVSPLSVLGMYPFSGYPIGIPFLFAVLFQIGFSIETAVLLLSMSFGIIGLFGAFKLGKEVFPDQQMALIFTAAYSLSHLFLRVTYSTLPTRGPFLAILPWFLWASLMFLRFRKRKYGIIAVGFLSILFFIHNLALFAIILYLGILIGYYLILGMDYLFKIKTIGIQEKIPINVYKKLKNSKDVFLWFLLFVAIAAAYFSGLALFSIDPTKTTPFLMSNDTFIGITINLIVDYGLRLGVLSIFFPLGIVASFHNDCKKKRKWLHFVLIPIVVFTIPVSKYASVIFLPVMTYYSVYGFHLAWRKSTRTLTLLSLLLFSVVYGVLYNLLVVSLPIFPMVLIFILGLCLVGLSIHELASKLSLTTIKLPSSTAIGFILLAIVLFSLVTTDGIIQQSDTAFMSNDEIAIAEYLTTFPDTGIIFVYDTLVARRLQAYGLSAIKGSNEQIGLQMGWITPEQIIENTQIEFRLNLFLLYGDIYSYTGILPESSLQNVLFGLDLTNNTNYSSAIEYNLRFVLVEKTTIGYSDTYQGAYCPLLHSAPLASELVFDSESIALFQLSS